jgi:hypothetical protein
VILNEVSGTFTTLPNPVSDPPQLPASSSVVANRYYIKSASTPLPQAVRHLQVKLSFPAENKATEVLGFALLKS